MRFYDGSTNESIVQNHPQFDNLAQKLQTLDIFSFLQNYAIEKNYERIQILSKTNLPTFNLLEKKLVFYLMKKSLN